VNELVLFRNDTGSEGTFGLLEGEALRMRAGELPWHDNRKMISCIPAQWYLCKPHISPKHGKCFWLQNVHGRDEILIHAANYMGDASEGYKTQLAGCIAIGMEFGPDAGANDQDMILKSQLAMQKLIEYTGFKPFGLTIVNNTQIYMGVNY